MIRKATIARNFFLELSRSNQKNSEIESKEIDREKIFPLLQGIDHW
jgi:hypothetical protein